MCSCLMKLVRPPPTTLWIPPLHNYRNCPDINNCTVDNASYRTSGSLCPINSMIFVFAPNDCTSLSLSIKPRSMIRSSLRDLFHQFSNIMTSHGQDNRVLRRRKKSREGLEESVVPFSQFSGVVAPELFAAVGRCPWQMARFQFRGILVECTILAGG